MKKTAWISTLMMLFIIASVLPASSALTGTSLVYGGEEWKDATLWWEVDFSNDSWTYTYYFYVPEGSKTIGHVILEASENATIEFSPITPEKPPEPKFGVYLPKQGNLGMPGSISGWKWDKLSGYSFVFSITSDMAPMWGDFYAKAGDSTWVYNTGFGGDGGAWNWNDGASDWLPVPSSSPTVVPIPPSVLLLGSGLGGLALMGLRRKPKS
jgi:hypothetical protein